MATKFQITMPEDLSADLKTVTMKMRIPLAQFIRETMEERLKEIHMQQNASDPFASITGLIDAEDTLASEVDSIYE